MKELHKLRTIYKLKNIERATSVGKRKESSAEHSWSCMILADYFLNKINQKLDRLKVYELLLYHDVVEIEAGDVNLIETEKRKQKQLLEKKAARKLKKELPTHVGVKFVRLFQEFEDSKTVEARFAKAIDALDAMIHELDYKKDWKGWTEEFLRKTKAPLFQEFPELQEAFEDIMNYLLKERYFEQ